MELTVTLFGGLRHYLPPGSQFNRCTIDIEDGARLDAILARLPIPDDKDYLVLVNDEKIERERYAEIAIGADDDVVLLPPLKGG